MKGTVTLALTVTLTVAGCAREATPARAPTVGPPYPYDPAPAPVAGAEPGFAALAPRRSAAPVLAAAPAGPPPAAPVVSRPDAPTTASGEIPGGEACLAELGRVGVAFRRLDDKRGVVTPVEVGGSIAGIRYQSGAGSSMVADCRLVLALHRVAPVLAGLGVTAVRFSGAYSYRMSRVGRLSLHAYGLALDVHEVRFGSTWHSVERHYARALADGCASTSPLLNQLVCRLRATRLFKELLTPDYDADHANHLHLAIAPGEPPTATPSKPTVARRPPARAPDDGEPRVVPDDAPTAWPSSPPVARRPPAHAADGEPRVIADHAPEPTPSKPALARGRAAAPRPVTRVGEPLAAPTARPAEAPAAHRSAANADDDGEPHVIADDAPTARPARPPVARRPPARADDPGPRRMRAPPPPAAPRARPAKRSRPTVPVGHGSPSRPAPPAAS